LHLFEQVVLAPEAVFIRVLTVNLVLLSI
jgi:hypothetical protein